MKYRVGPWSYVARVTAEPLMHLGVERMGMCLEGTREILISPACPARSRLLMLLHELAHAWIFHTGRPRELEEWCDLFATMTAAALSDLAINGGPDALMRLEPGESPQPMTARVALTRNRYCPICTGTVAGGSVECRPASLPGILDMALYCEHCDRKFSWQEAATCGGMPSGIVVGE